MTGLISMTGILVADGSFELLCAGQAVGTRRPLDEAAATALREFGQRYYRQLQPAYPGAFPANSTTEFLKLGHDLYRWLDGDLGQMNTLLQRARRPLQFEICTSNLNPHDDELALLRLKSAPISSDDPHKQSSANEPRLAA